MKGYLATQLFHNHFANRENHADEAIYMPLSSLGDALPKMADTGQTVFFLPPDAQSGAAVAEILRGLGYTRIYELTGI